MIHPKETDNSETKSIELSQDVDWTPEQLQSWEKLPRLEKRYRKKSDKDFDEEDWTPEQLQSWEKLPRLERRNLK